MNQWGHEGCGFRYRVEYFEGMKVGELRMHISITSIYKLWVKNVW